MDLCKHKIRCKKRPSLLREQSGSVDFLELSNKEFLAVFEQRLCQPGFSLEASSIRVYVSKVRQMIARLEQGDANFRAGHWLLQADHESYRRLPPLRELIPTHYYGSSVKQLVVSYT